MRVSETFPQAELGERYRLVVLKAAELKSEALRLEKMAKRIEAALIIDAKGSHALRKTIAKNSPEFQAVEDAWLKAKHDANAAGAEADALRLKMEAWRTIESTKRAEMQHLR